MMVCSFSLPLLDGTIFRRRGNILLYTFSLCVNVLSRNREVFDSIRGNIQFSRKSHDMHALLVDVFSRFSNLKMPAVFVLSACESTAICVRVLPYHDIVSMNSIEIRVHLYCFGTNLLRHVSGYESKRSINNPDPDINPIVYLFIDTRCIVYYKSITVDLLGNNVMFKDYSVINFVCSRIKTVPYIR